MDLLKKIYEKINDYFWNNLTHLLIFLFSFAIVLLICSYFITDDKISLIIKNIGLILISGAVFQFILKSKGFIRVINETFDHTNRQWDKYSFEYIHKLLETIKITHSFFEFDFNKTEYESITKAKEDFIEMYENAKSGLRDKDKDDLLRRNFFIKKLTNIRTIYNNDCEIVYIKADIDIFKDGIFKFKYMVKLSNPDNNFPPFEEMLNNTNNTRFDNFSFSARVFNLPESLINSELIINATTNNEKEKHIEMMLSQTLLAGQSFSLEFSITIKNEYTENFIKTIKEEDKPHSNSKYPIGIRHFIVQQEHYAQINNKYKCNPKILINNKPIDKLTSNDNLFYKCDEWKIYYSKESHKTIKLDLFP